MWTPIQASLFIGMLVCQIDRLGSLSIPMNPGTYLKDSSLIQPLVSLCNVKSVVISDLRSIDICLTVNPATPKGNGRSSVCTGLQYSDAGYNRYKIEEKNDHCMVKLRNHAGSVGIKLDTPIYFTYTREPTTENMADFVATVAVHLGWAQKNVQFNSLISGKASSSFGITSIIILLLILVAV